MISVKWYNTCYMCRAPLDYAVSLAESDLEKFYTYSNFKPKNFIHNLSYHKIIGLNQRKLCLSCYCTKKTKSLPGPRDLMKREIGTRLKKPEGALTERDVYTWFEDFDHFRKRKDIDELVDQNYKYATPGLIILIWR